MIILSLGGIGKRFLDAGIMTPKYLLIYQDKSILEHIIANISSDEMKILCLMNRKDMLWKNEVEEQLKKVFESVEIHFVENTRGQADTVRIGIEYVMQKLQRDFEIYVYNGDTIGPFKNLDLINKKLQDYNADGAVEYFFGTKSSYSYINFDYNNLVTQIKEKIVISNYATTGFYVFSSAKNYLDLYRIISNRSSNNEIYISELYAESINRKGKIIAIPAQADPVILGTPDEYNSAIHKL